MKNDTSNKIRLGIFISIGIALFILGIYFIGDQQQLFSSTFHLKAVFNDVAGLQVGNNVRLSGVNVGSVENITIISDTSVIVEMVINESTRKFIMKGAIASIGSEGLMGNKALIINPGAKGKNVIEDYDIIGATNPNNLDDVFSSLKSTLDHAATITRDLSKITSNIEAGEGTIGKLLMDKSLAGKFDSSFINLSEATKGLKNLIDKATVSLAQINMDEIIVPLKTTIDNASNITTDLSIITRNIQTGKGSLGKLLMDDSTAQNIGSTFNNINDASVEFKLLLKKAQSSWLLWGF